jgi:hypothetical protein
MPADEATKDLEKAPGAVDVEVANKVEEKKVV